MQHANIANDAQRRTVGQNDTLQALGKCLDVAGGATADSTAVDLYTCNSTRAQEWLPTTGGEPTNPQSGKCLDDPGDGGSGTALVLYACGQGANEEWNLP